MTIDTKYKKILTDQTGYLSQMQRACENRYAEIDKEALQLQKNSKGAEKGLKDQLYSIKPSILHKKIKKLVVDRKSISSSAKQSGNFDRFMYYIDMINAKKTPKYIVKNNPNYCDMVLCTAVDEYHRLCGDIVRTRTNQKDVIRNKKDEFLASSKKQVADKVSAFYKQLEILAEEEADSIIREVSH